MKTIGSKFLAALMFGFVALSASAANVGVSINIGEPNFYGRINAAERYRPQVIYERPIVVQQSAYTYQPMYLRVPPRQVKNWNRHCSAYGACGRPVYFVKDSWYREKYRDRYYRQDYDRDRGRDRGHEYDRHDRYRRDN